ncbi:MAG: RadC family protein [Clostridia bacterium]|nr:RadC family protein [Clostridia bacterium]
MPNEKGHLHGGHRARMRARVLQTGPESLADHELLEMLLYYSIPRSDTNNVAHGIIERFGALSGALEARIEQLSDVEGVGESSALFLRLVGELARRYAAQKLEVGEPEGVFDDPAKIAAFLYPRFLGLTVERVYLLLFDNGMRLLDCMHVCDGSVSGVLISTRRMVERAVAKNAAAVILAHNHPGGKAVPSGEDMRLTRQIDHAFRLLEIPLLEHYVFSDHSFAPIMGTVRAEQDELQAATSLPELFAKRKNELRAMSDLTDWE